MPCFNFLGRGNKVAAVRLSLNLSIIFDPCLPLQRSSGCAARRALEGAPYRRCPQTTATHHPRMNGQHTPPTPYQSSQTETGWDNSTEPEGTGCPVMGGYWSEPPVRLPGLTHRSAGRRAGAGRCTSRAAASPLRGGQTPA